MKLGVESMEVGVESIRGVELTSGERELPVDSVIPDSTGSYWIDSTVGTGSTRSYSMNAAILMLARLAKEASSKSTSFEVWLRTMPASGILGF